MECNNLAEEKKHNRSLKNSPTLNHTQMNVSCSSKCQAARGKNNSATRPLLSSHPQGELKNPTASLFHFFSSIYHTAAKDNGVNMRCTFLHRVSIFSYFDYECQKCAACLVYCAEMHPMCDAQWRLLRFAGYMSTNFIQDDTSTIEKWLINEELFLPPPPPPPTLIYA